jgi:hypothetical protein
VMHCQAFSTSEDERTKGKDEMQISSGKMPISGTIRNGSEGLSLLLHENPSLMMSKDATAAESCRSNIILIALPNPNIHMLAHLVIRPYKTAK